MTDEGQGLIDAFTRIVKLLGKLPDNDARRRVIAAVVCIYDDASSRAALVSWQQRREGAV